MLIHLENIKKKELVKCDRDGEILKQVLREDTGIDIEILIGGKMEYQYNRGKICKKDGCNNIARVKGLCMNCYQHKRKKLGK